MTAFFAEFWFELYIASVFFNLCYFGVFVFRDYKGERLLKKGDVITFLFFIVFPFLGAAFIFVEHLIDFFVDHIIPYFDRPLFDK